MDVSLEIVAIDHLERVGTYAPGAGFSNNFPCPPYQKAAVSQYIASLNDQYNGLYNVSGRAYPDIVAQSVNIPIIFSGELICVDRTR